MNLSPMSMRGSHCLAVLVHRPAAPPWGLEQAVVDVLIFYGSEDQVLAGVSGVEERQRRGVGDVSVDEEWMRQRALSYRLPSAVAIDQRSAARRTTAPMYSISALPPEVSAGPVTGFSAWASAADGDLGETFAGTARSFARWQAVCPWLAPAWLDSPPLLRWQRG